MITERVMQLGDWDLTLRPDTPKSIREKIVPFSQIVFMPGRLPAGDMSDSLLPTARFTGVVTRPGPYHQIAGHSLSLYLGTGDRWYTTTAAALPEIAIVDGGLGIDLTTQLGWVVSSTGLTLGTITDPTGGAQKTSETIQWIAQRELLDSLCKRYEVEWRMSPAGVLDVGPHTTLYPTPTVVVSESAGGRGIGFTGVRALIDKQIDYWDFASKIYVMGRAKYATAGSSSPYFSFNGFNMFVTAVVDGADIALGDEAFAASRLITRYNAPTQTVTVESDMLDLSGTIGAGDRIYVWDPSANVYNLAVSPPAIEWQGETIYPLTFRAVSVRWPVEQGMGVLLRRYVSALSLEYVDLTDYVEWEHSTTTYEVGADINFNWRISRGLA